jgi:alpha-tubulin suppressor-like RCC1 family protein
MYLLLNVSRANGETLVSWGGICAPKIPPGIRFKYIAAGYTSFAISTKGTIYGWGISGDGECNFPNGLTNVTALCSGDQFVIALKPDGNIAVWGDDNTWGQTNIPPDATNITAIACAGPHGVALKADGTVTAWGVLNTVPSDLTNVIAVGAGIFHDIALKGDGTVVTWGEAPYGSITVPDGLSNVVAVSGGWDHTIALKSDGTAVYWGNTNKTVSNIVAIAAGGTDIVLASNGSAFRWDDNGLTFLGYSNVVAISSAPGENNILLLQEDGTVISTGDNIWGESTPPGSLTNIIAVTAGDNFTVALKTDGTLMEMGLDDDTGAQVSSATNIIAIAAGRGDILGLTQNHIVINWPDWDDSFTPPGRVTNVTAIAVGFSHAMALRQDGTVATWGMDELPPPQGLKNVKAIAAGDGFCLALQSNGVVTAWGDDFFGECDVPSDLTDAIAIAAGSRHSVAVKSDGTIVAWGDDQDGEIEVPPGLSNVVSVASWCDSEHTLALQRNGTVVAWGWADFGQFPFPNSFGNALTIAVGANHSVAVVRDTPSFGNSRMREDGSFQTDFFGDLGWDYIYQSSTNLITWNDLTTLTCTNSRIPLIDAPATGTKRFYRIKVKPD